MPRKWAPVLTLLATIHQVHGSLKSNIHGIKHMQDTHAAKARLKHVEAANKVISFAQNVSPTLSSLKTVQALDTTSGSLQVYTSFEVPVDVPTACSTALTANVACNSTVLKLGLSINFSKNDLDLMCTGTCTKSLNLYRSNVASTCASYMITDPSDSSLYPPTLAADVLLSSYNTACETDGSGAYCGPILASYGSVASGQTVLSWPQDNLCTTCTMGALNITVANPYTYTVNAWNTLQSALRTCGSNFAQYNVTNPPIASASSISVPGPSSKPHGSNSTFSNTCLLTGRNITVALQSTCATLGTQFSVTASDVLMNNPLLSSADCTAGVLAGANLCIPQSCTLLTPNGTQTCDDIVSAVNQGSLSGKGQKISHVQLTTWNPNLQSACLLLAFLDPTEPLCIGPHGGWPTVAANPTINGGNPVITPTATVPPPGQTAPGATKQCGEWVFAVNGTNCQQLILNSGVTFGDFRVMNPMVDENCYNLWADYWYCVAPYPPLDRYGSGLTVTAGQTQITMATLSLPVVPTASPTPAPPDVPVYDTPPHDLAPGSITLGCSFYRKVSSDDAAVSDACNTLATKWGMDPTLFAFYNNNTASPCPTLVAGTSICLAVLNTTAAAEGMGPVNRMVGSGPYGCRNWYTVVTGDDCGKVTTRFGLTSQQFFVLNPEVKSDCTNLGLDAAYCVYPPPAAAIPSTTTTPGSSTSTTSSPTQAIAAGSWTNCTSYYAVQSGESCPSLETKFGISQSDFLKWNPEIKDLDIQRYCVAGTPAACGKSYTVVSGDFCSLVESKTGISDATLRSLNPWLDANCDLQVSQNLCVAAPTPKPTNIALGSWTNCTSYYQVVSNDNCNKIQASFGISFTDLLRWNSGINTACSNLALSSYCVNGSPRSCGKTDAIVSGDFCSQVENRNSISDATFRALNPWLDVNCDLQIGQLVCVAPDSAGGVTTSLPTTITSTTSTQSTSTAMTTTSAGSKPTNIATGSWSNCTTYYQVVTNDNCNIIDSQFGISFTDLLKWNAGVNTACSNLALSSYCVKGSPQPCKKVHVVASGEFCFEIYSDANLTEAQFRALNPWLDSACSIQLGQSMCIA